MTPTREPVTPTRPERATGSAAAGSVAGATAHDAAGTDRAPVACAPAARASVDCAPVACAPVERAARVSADDRRPPGRGPIDPRAPWSPADRAGPPAAGSVAARTWRSSGIPALVAILLFAASPVHAQRPEQDAPGPDRAGDDRPTNESPAAADDPFAGLDVPAPADLVPATDFEAARFAERARRDLGAGDAALEQFARDLEAEGARHATEALLRALVVGFEAAWTAPGDEAVDLLRPFTSADRPAAIRAHARFRIAEALAASGHEDRAAEVLVRMLREDAGSTPLDAAAFSAIADHLAAVPAPRAALAYHEAFATAFPDAPAAMKAHALRRATVLRARLLDDDRGVLASVADEMRRIARALERAHTGDDTQRRQRDVISKLERTLGQLEERMEQREQTSSSSAENGQQQSNPASASRLPNGEGGVGELRRFDDTSARWGGLDPERRSAVEAVVEERMPAHHKRWLEDYFRALGRER